jgi:hypothetical protein
MQKANEYRWVFSTTPGAATGNPIGIEIARPSTGETVVFETGDNIVVAKNDDEIANGDGEQEEGADYNHAKIKRMWETPKGKKMVELQWYYTVRTDIATMAFYVNLCYSLILIHFVLSIHSPTHHTKQKADLENLECDFQGLLNREEVLGSLGSKELLFSNHADNNEISVIAAKFQEVTCHLKIIFDPKGSRATLEELAQGQCQTEVVVVQPDEVAKFKPENATTSVKKRKVHHAPSLFELHDLSEHAVAKAVAQHLPPRHRNHGLQVSHFFLFLHERQMVWERRNREDPPWTESVALRDYYFCNVSHVLF